MVAAVTPAFTKALENNLNALRLSSDLKSRGELPSESESVVLDQYAGWGAFSPLFDSRRSELETQREELKLLLGESRFNDIRRSILDSYYTPAAIAKFLWSGLARMGFKRGKVLDPAVGSGALVDASLSVDLENDIDWTCIEKCSATADLFSLRHPRTKIINKDYTDLAIPNDSFQAAIMNPPFGEWQVRDPFEKNLSNLSVHNLFVAKTLRKIQPGGLCAVVVSRYFMDGYDSKAREQAGKVAKLIGAWRLPSGCFKDSGTDVITDLLFFQRTDDAGELNGDEWMDSVPWESDTDGIRINRWYVENPGNLLGVAGRVSNQYRQEDFGLTALGNIQEDLDRIINNLPENIYSVDEELVFEHTPNIQVENDTRTKVFGYCIDDSGLPAQRVNDILGQKSYKRVEIPETKVVRLKKLLALRDTLSDLLEAESAGMPGDPISSLRSKLNSLYDAFVTSHGAIHGIGNSFLKYDPDYALLLGLEFDYDPGISKAKAKKEGVDAKKACWKKADIFYKRVCYPHNPHVSVNNALDALVYSLKNFGRIHFDYMNEISGIAVDELKHDLTGKIFCSDPANNTWVTGDEYLSGNVKKKLSEARKLSVDYPWLKGNIQALEKVIPKDIPAHEIYVTIGAPWLPGAVLAEFCQHMVDAEIKEPIHAGGEWYLNFFVRDGSYAKQTSRFGTERLPFSDIFKKLINNKSLTVYDVIDEKRVVNTVETTAVEEKADEIKEAWENWIFADTARRDLVSKLYNDLFNTSVVYQADGSFLADDNGLLPNQNPAIKLAPHQLNTAWRAIVTGNLLADQSVGSGKTFMAACAAMEMKRMGLVSKTIITVPNHLVTSWRTEIARLYPSAKVLTAQNEAMSKVNRRQFLATATLNEYDIILIPHSSFIFIPAPQEYSIKFFEEQLEDLEAGILAATKSNDHSIVRQLEKRKQSLSNKLKNLLSRPSKDTTLSFDQLGADMMIIDESQVMKNLYFSSSHSGLSGMGTPDGSQRAADFFAKARYLQDKNNGRGLISLTATPISNSMVEMYTVMRYHMYNDLRAAGLHYLDTWISVFAIPSSEYEMTVSGSFKQKSRLRRFCNIPELMRLYRSFAEIITKSDLKAIYRENNMPWPEPEMTTGKPIIITAERSPVQDEYFEKILERAENMGEADPSVDNWLLLTTDANKASLDMRLIDPTLEDYAGSKVNKCVDETFRLYKLWDDKKGTQIIFCDLGTPKPGEQKSHLRHCVYSDIKLKLMAKGIPESEIAFIHDANTDTRKEHLFRLVNKGIVRILLGSSSTLGAGANIQSRVIGLHHLDLPWRPSDEIQRSGRALRRGNLFFENDNSFTVNIYWYATKLTLDSHRSQTLETKSRFIEQVKSSDLRERIVSDIGDESSSNFAEIKAMVSGNPLLLKHFQTEQRIKKLERAKNAHKQKIWSAESRIQLYSNYQDEYADNVKRHGIDMERLDTYGNELTFITIGGDEYKGDTLKEGLMKHLSKAFSMSRFKLINGLDLGSVNGFDFTLRKEHKYMVFGLKGAFAKTFFEYEEGSKISVQGLITRMRNFIRNIPDNMEKIQATHDRIRDELAILQEEIQCEFDKQSELDRLKELHRAITISLADEDYEIPEELLVGFDQVKESSEATLSFEEHIEPLPQKPVSQTHFSVAIPGTLNIAMGPS